MTSHFIGVKKKQKKIAKRENGVTFVLTTTLASKLEELPYSVNERIILLCPFKKGRYVTQISVNAPTMNANENDKFSFYDVLKEKSAKFHTGIRLSY